jgi:hypothetical protein
LSLSGFLGDIYYKGSTTNLTSINDITSEYYPFSKAIKTKFFYVRGDNVEESFNQANRFVISNGNNKYSVDANILRMVDTKIDDGLPLSGFISIVPTIIVPTE